jgi:plastocyanin
MSKKQTIVLIIIAVIVLGGLVYLGVTQGPVVTPGEEEGGEATTTKSIGETQVQGGSMVTEGGKVVTDEGEPVDNTAAPGSPTAPQQSDPISEDSVPRGAIKIQVSAAGFEPSEFTVNSGEVVTLSVASVDEQTHIFKFKDPSLKAVAVGVGPGEVRALTFNAPDKRGEYQFFCDVPGHAGRGETGTMTVK